MIIVKKNLNTLYPITNSTESIQTIWLRSSSSDWSICCSCRCSSILFCCSSCDCNCCWRRLSSL